MNHQLLLKHLGVVLVPEPDPAPAPAPCQAFSFLLAGVEETNGKWQHIGVLRSRISEA